MDMSTFAAMSLVVGIERDVRAFHQHGILYESVVEL
jgi:hypothetical protein